MRDRKMILMIIIVWLIIMVLALMSCTATKTTEHVPVVVYDTTHKTWCCPRKPATITYAINGIYKKAGRINGPRGCLRDSQGDSVFFEDWPLHNWTSIFKIQIQ